MLLEEIKTPLLLKVQLNFILFGIVFNDARLDDLIPPVIVFILRIVCLKCCRLSLDWFD